MPISIVKLDKQVVQQIEHEREADELAHGIVALAHGQSMAIIAEGVETEAHAKFLRTHHPRVCLQGYYFGYPQPITALFPAE